MAVVVTGVDGLEGLFIGWALLFMAVLILHFALRRSHLELIEHYGWLVYALGLPAFIVSLLLLFGGKPWSLWLGGVLQLLWSAYGYYIEYLRRIPWRSPPRWGIFIPYVGLYLAMLMFYWWPLGMLSRPLWFLYALLFVLGSWLNLSSHRPRQR